MSADTRQLTKAGADMNEVRREIAQKEGQSVVTRAKFICRNEKIIDTGNLRNSFHAEPAQVGEGTVSVVVANNADYASHVEYGHLTGVGSGGAEPLRNRHMRALSAGHYVRGRYVLSRAVHGVLRTQEDRIINEQSQLAIEMALDEAEIPQDERTISLDGMVQAALFVYFEGFFDLPVSSSELAPGGNGLLSQCGEVSELHQYTYGSKDMGVPEKGITLALKEKTAVHVNLLDCGDCIQDIYVYDVWNMDEQDIANDTNSKVYNRSAVTLAYIIDTAQFEADYGFPFPSIDGVSNAGTITLFLEFTCLSEVEFEDADISSSLDSGDIIVGYSHDGYYSGRYDSGLWRHRLNRDECVPHVGVKTYFMFSTRTAAGYALLLRSKRKGYRCCG